jgi:hypothetical protein
VQQNRREVSPAEEPYLAAVQKAVQEVTEKLGYEDGSGNPGEGRNCVFHSRNLGQFGDGHKRQGTSEGDCRNMPQVAATGETVDGRGRSNLR